MTYRNVVGASSALVLILATRFASAQQAELPPPAPPAAAVQKPIVNGEHTCLVGEHEGIDPADARTTTYLVCAELGPRKAAPGEYDVRFGKLGSRVLFSVRSRPTGEERSVMLSSFEEAPVASVRLVTALAAHTSLDQTQTVDNVVSAESRKPKTKSGSTAVYLGLVGMTAAGITASASAGGEIGVYFRSGRAAFGGRFRFGGLGSGDHKLGFVGLDAAARYYLSDADVSTFLGGGLGVSYARANGDELYETSDDSPSGSGFGANLEAGVEIFRSSTAAASLSLRADVPFYALKAESTSTSYGYDYRSPAVHRTRSTVEYAVPISVNFGFAFH